MKHNTLGLLDSEVKILYTALKYYVEENVGTKKEKVISYKNIAERNT